MTCRSTFVLPLSIQANKKTKKLVSTQYRPLLSGRFAPLALKNLIVDNWKLLLPKFLSRARWMSLRPQKLMPRQTLGVLLTFPKILPFIKIWNPPNHIFHNVLEQILRVTRWETVSRCTSEALHWFYIIDLSLRFIFWPNHFVYQSLLYVISNE